MSARLALDMFIGYKIHLFKLVYLSAHQRFIQWIEKDSITFHSSYDSLPKSISDFVIKIDGLIHLNYRSRVLNINVDKAIDSTLFMIDMQARDLELPEFTKLFTQTEILQDELPRYFSVLKLFNAQSTS